MNVSNRDWDVVPTLRGNHVVLRPLVLEDTEAVIRAHDDPSTLEYFPFGIHSDPPSAATITATLADPSRQALVQVDTRTGEVVGITSIYQMDSDKGQLTIGYTWLSAKVRGGVHNSEAKLLLLSYAFDTLGAVRVQLVVDDRNEPSLAAVRTLGATEEGRLRKHARRRDGSWRTTVVFSILDDEWPHVRTRLSNRIGANLRRG